MELCTDRAQIDVDKLRAISGKIGRDGLDSLSKEDIELWRRGDGSVVYTTDQQTIVFTDGTLKLAPVFIRGAYNAADLNRVTAAMLYLEGRFRGIGYGVRLEALPEAWTGQDLPQGGNMERYLTNLRRLRGVLELFPTTPPVPRTMDKLTWQEANDIEQILLDVDWVLTAASNVYRHSGAAVSAMGGLIR